MALPLKKEATALYLDRFYYMQKNIIIWLLAALLPAWVSAQGLLDKPISITVQKQRLDEVLEIIGNKAGLTFSYNSNAVKRDSLVSLNVTNKKVKDVLDIIWKTGYEYKQSGNYIIIRKIPVLPDNKPPPEKYYTITGYIIDNETGQKISNASIYEKQQLAATLSGQDGFFKLRLKAKYNQAAITVSKELYLDTTINIYGKQSQQVSIIIRNEVVIKPPILADTNEPPLWENSEPAHPDTLPKPVAIATDTPKVEKKWLGAMLLSSQQKIQSLNLRKFFTEKPFQISLTPGISTHGKMSGQVINHVSINTLGGYTGGLNGVELGGMFNISKKNVQYFQAAGLFNQVGGYVRGVQAAGISNSVLDSVNGVQSAGISNFVKGRFRGLQASGISNIVMGDVNGVQLAGISSIAKGWLYGFQASAVYNHAGSMKGAQVSGTVNYSAANTNGLQLAAVGNVSGNVSGVQFSSIFNYASHLKGLQIGLINIADSSDGYSLGLFNIVKHGYHKLDINTNETMPLNVSFKGGNKKLYSILALGTSANQNKQLYAFGLGIGSELKTWRRLDFNVDIIPQYLYTGSWDNTNILTAARPYFQYRPAKWIGLYAGPAFNVYYSNQTAAVTNYQFNVPQNSLYKFNISSKVNAWVGWQFGINLF